MFARNEGGSGLRVAGESPVNLLPIRHDRADSDEARIKFLKRGAQPPHQYHLAFPVERSSA